MKKICLNGWWDFHPIYTEDFSQENIPQDAWIEKAYLVPSLWRKPLDCVKSSQEEFFRNFKQDDLKNIENLDFLYDDYKYPNKWTSTKNAWIKRSFNLESIDKFKRYFILLEAVMPYSKVFVNGIFLSKFIHPTLPNEVDITKVVKEGDNELCILVIDYEKDEYGRFMTPTGTDMITGNAGIWQDVFLHIKDSIYLEDVCIRTYYRNKKIEAFLEILNTENEDFDLEIETYIEEFKSEKRVFNFENKKLKIKANSKGILHIHDIFKDAKLWEPHNPNLYYLNIVITSSNSSSLSLSSSSSSSSSDNNKLSSSYKERFGFRQIEIKGKDLLLNGKPVHLFSDWGHKVTSYQFTKDWIKSWYQMIRDGNMNHTRLHTCPHPKILLDIADEEGILITGETGLHGSGGAQASNSNVYWDNARDHVKRFVKRDKNHPSLILWSVENEMRWNLKGDELDYPKKIIENLPKLKALINQLDPSRYAYHEGDSSLWDESKQDIISRHYGKDAAGADWWDEKKPLHLGEIGFYHYEGPNTALHLMGGKAFIDYKNIDIATGLDLKMIIEYGRTKGIVCFGPWNQSCLKLLRSENQDISLNYNNFEKEGIKPLLVKAHTSEFSFWKEGRNYETQESFEIQKQAFRPFALIDYNKQSLYFANEKIQREVFLVNDKNKEIEGTLRILLNKKTIFEKTVYIGQGLVQKVEFSFDVKSNAKKESQELILKNDLIYEFYEKEELLDKQSHDINIFHTDSNEYEEIFSLIKKKKITCFKAEEISLFLKDNNVDTFDVLDLFDLECMSLRNTDLLILGKDCLEKDSTIHKTIRRILEEGISVLLLEQKISIFKDMKLTLKPLLTSFKTNSIDFLSAFDENLLSFWGNDPYVKTNNNGEVATYLYEKDYEEKSYSYILETGEGSFGRGDLSFSPLLYIQNESVILIANQMNISEKIDYSANAQLLFINLLKDIFSFKSHDEQVYYLKSNQHFKFDEIKEQIKAGKTLVIEELKSEDILQWNSLLDTSLELVNMDDIYQGKLTNYDNYTKYLSNSDLYGINTYSYSRPDSKNYILAASLLKKNSKTISLIETCRKSLNKELFVKNGQTELRRAYTVSKYRKKNKDLEEFDIVVKMNYGQGFIYINQIANNSSFPKFKYVLGKLRNNLKNEYNEEFFHYEKIEAKTLSNGYPEYVYLSNKMLSPWIDYVNATKSNNERMAHKKNISIGSWKQVVFGSKGISSEQEKPGKILLSFNIFSSEARQSSENNLGIPNPEEFTFITLKGEGYITCAINGIDYQKKEFVDGSVTFADVSLNKGINYLTFLWEPTSASTLNLIFHNINKKIEEELTFM